MPKIRVTNIGDRSGKLIIKDIFPKAYNGGREPLLLTVCDCGNEKKVSKGNFNNGSTISCGCVANNEKNLRHGMSRTAIYKTWVNMKNRCSENGHKDYGQRGITVCDEWQSFELFLSDMGDSYFKGATIERIEVNGNYEKSNCRWANKQEQHHNKRNTLTVMYHGKEQNLKLLCKEKNMEYIAVYMRIKRLNWSVEDSIDTPIKTIKHGKAY
jgi:hypothetical protein